MMNVGSVEVWVIGPTSAGVEDHWREGEARATGHREEGHHHDMRKDDQAGVIHGQLRGEKEDASCVSRGDT